MSDKLIPMKGTILETITLGSWNNTMVPAMPVAEIA